MFSAFATVCALQYYDPDKVDENGCFTFEHKREYQTEQECMTADLTNNKLGLIVLLMQNNETQAVIVDEGCKTEETDA